MLLPVAMLGSTHGYYKGGIGVVVLFILVFLLLFIALYISKKEKLAEFEDSIRLEGSRLTLPERVPVEQGVVKVKCYLASYGAISIGIGTRAGPPRGPSYNVEVSVENPVLVETDVIELDKLCSKPFYVFSHGGESYVIAPGFVVRSGRFEGVIGLCFNRDTIPLKRVEVKAGSPPEEATGLLELSPEGFKSTVSWLFKAPTTARVIYDEKAGVYRVVEEPVSKPKARGARLEVCYQKPDDKWKCTVLAETEKPNIQTTGGFSWSIEKNLLFITRDLVEYELASRLAKAIKIKGLEGRSIVAGYAPQHVKVKLVLDIPMGEDITHETFL